MIKTEKLSFQYPGLPAFFYPQIQCNTGEKLAVLGESGVGKSTLLHLLGGLLKPKAGKVIINDQDIYELPLRKLDAFRGANIGIIFQQAHFMKALTVEENLKLSCFLANKRYLRKEINDVMDQLGLPHKMHSKPDQLSVGEQQRFSIARALVTQPSVVLADEPTSALDDKNCYKVLDLLNTLCTQSKAALIIVTHDKRVNEVVENRIELSALNMEK